MKHNARTGDGISISVSQCVRKKAKVKSWSGATVPTPRDEKHNVICNFNQCYSLSVGRLLCSSVYPCSVAALEYLSPIPKPIRRLFYTPRGCHVDKMIRQPTENALPRRDGYAKTSPCVVLGQALVKPLGVPEQEIPPLH